MCVCVCVACSSYHAFRPQRCCNIAGVGATSVCVACSYHAFRPRRCNIAVSGVHYTRACTCAYCGIMISRFTIISSLLSPVHRRAEVL